MSPYRKRSGERGAAAVEFALVVPLLITLVFGIVDFGYAINRYAMINNATREGARAASLSQSAATVVAVTKAAATSDVRPGMSVNVSCIKANLSACSSWDAGKESGGEATVTVSYTYNWITPVGSLFGSSLSINKSTKMRIE
jgi:Flp pilus assembly protein TadG